MELVLVIAVSAVVVWFFFFRNKDEVNEAISPAPYKLEPETTAESTPVPSPVASIEESTILKRRQNRPKVAVPLLVEVSAPVVEPAKVAKKPAAKRTAKPKTEKPAAKATATKPRAKKPKMTVAK